MKTTRLMLFGLLLGAVPITVPAGATGGPNDEQLASEVGVAILLLPIAGLMAEASVGGQELGFHPLEE